MCFVWNFGGVWDHPRSRGVYLAEREGKREEDGIIPARAGFTTQDAFTTHGPADHPRSRGVYPLRH